MALQVRIIAALFITGGLLMFVGAVLSSILASALAGFVTASGEDDAGVIAALLSLGGMAMTMALVAFGIPAVVCGWGLLKFRPWARVLAIILGAIALLEVPLGTIFGVWVLVVMFRKDGEALFGVGAPA